MPKEECTKEALDRVLAKAGAPCPPEALPALADYVSMLMRWNRVMNLVGARTWRDAAEDLVADCLLLAGFLDSLPLPESPVSCDLGSGAGLPGIPLRLVWQKGSYDMVELRQKRAMFLSQVLGTLNLAATRAHNADARVFLAGKNIDLVISRAFMPWEKVLELVRPHLAPEGLVVFMASEIPADAEIAAKAPGFARLASHTYSCRAGTRHFWAARPRAEEASA